jgi:4-hydroxybenzoate polyprenyltransferase
MQKILNFLDSLDFGPVTIVVTIFIIALVRLFLESFSSPEATGLFAPIIGILSYASLYGMLLALFTLLLGAISKKSMMWSLRVVTLVFPLVILTPIIDLMFSGGTGFCIGYVQPGSGSFVSSFFTFLLPHGNNCGITPGLGIQIIIATLGVAGIVWITTKSWWRTLIGGIGTYAIAFIGGVLPIIVNLVTREDATHTFLSDAMASLLTTIHYPTESAVFTVFPSTVTTALLARIQLLIAIGAIAIIWFFASRFTWRAWWLGSYKKIPIALIHFALMIFGLLIGFGVGEPNLIWPDWVGIITLMVALFLACWNLGVANDIPDMAIDRISNPDRPLIKYGMTVEQAKTIQSISGILAIACAFTINYNVAFCIAAFLGFYTLHSTGLRLKRFWPTASLLIILSGCAAFLAGFFTLSADQIVGNMPLSVIVMISTMLIPYTFIKDLPDVKGDTEGKLNTLPVLYGVPATLVVVALSTIAWLALFWAIIPWFFSLGAIISLFVIGFWKRSWIHDKPKLLGLPIGIWTLGLLTHLLFFL